MARPARPAPLGLSSTGPWCTQVARGRDLRGDRVPGQQDRRVRDAPHTVHGPGRRRGEHQAAVGGVGQERVADAAGPRRRGKGALRVHQRRERGVRLLRGGGRGAGEERQGRGRSRCIGSGWVLRGGTWVRPRGRAPLDTIPHDVQDIQLVGDDGVQPAAAHHHRLVRGELLGGAHLAQVAPLGIEDVEPGARGPRGARRKDPEVSRLVRVHADVGGLLPRDPRRVHLSPLVGEPLEPFQRLFLLGRGDGDGLVPPLHHPQGVAPERQAAILYRSVVPAQTSPSGSAAPEDPGAKGRPAYLRTPAASPRSNEGRSCSGRRTCRWAASVASI